MNISGIAVKTTPEHLDQVIESLKVSGLCEIHFQDVTGRIIITVEGKDTNEEIRKLREIINLPNVLCADLAYSFIENETDINLRRFKLNGDAVPEALKSLPTDL